MIRFRRTIAQESLGISIASRDIDFSDYSALSAYSPSSESTWTAGVTVYYGFLFESDCNGSTFCQFLTQTYGSGSEYHLTGVVDANGLDLASPLTVVNSSLLRLDIFNLELHVGLTFVSPSLELYVKVEGLLSLPPDSAFTVTGNLDLSSNETTFNGTSSDTWMNILDLDSINLYNLVFFSAHPSSNVSTISLEGSGPIIFGTNCFSQGAEGASTFQSSECVYGNANVDLDDASESSLLVQGDFDSLTQSQILHGITGFNSSFIKSNVASVANFINFENPIRFHFTTSSTASGISSSEETSEVTVVAGEATAAIQLEQVNFAFAQGSAI